MCNSLLSGTNRLTVQKCLKDPSNLRASRGGTRGCLSIEVVIGGSEEGGVGGTIVAAVAELSSEVVGWN